MTRSCLNLCALGLTAIFASGCDVQAQSPAVDGSFDRTLQVSGPAGQVGVLQSSTDLVQWQDVATVYLPDGTVQFQDDAAAAAVKYYRLQVR